MVKFSKQFEGQLVPEWKHAFVDYRLLKKDLKRMQHAVLLGQHHDHYCSRADPTKTTQRSCRPQLLFHNLFGGNAPKDRGVIQVRRKRSVSRGGGDAYETELLAERFAGGGEDTGGAAREFFARLDAQLNKVNHFYKGKEKEFLERGQSLWKQMDILADLKAAREADPSVSSSSVTSGSEDESRRYVTTAAPDTHQSEQETTPTKDDSGTTTRPQGLEGSGGFAGPAPEPTIGQGRSAIGGCQQRKGLKINIPVTNPSRTISALTDILWEDLVAGQLSSSKKCNPDGKQPSAAVVNKTKLRHAEKMLKGAFVELYKGLGYLATYRNLNMMAFVKILKKFEKVSGKQVLAAYLKAVETSYFNSSDEGLKLMDEVEDVFVRHFAGGDRRKAMGCLKPTQGMDSSHAATFFTGLMTGCSAALLAGYCAMAHASGVYDTTTARRDVVTTTVYMETSYPVVTVFALLLLHLLLHGCSMVAWRRCRVNYGFIFQQPVTAGGERDLRPHDVFLVCAASVAAVAGAMVAHLALVLGGYHASSRVQAIPGILVLVFLLLLFCPFNVVYRSSRFRFLRTLRNIVLSPFYKVVMVDFFMADQLCSQVPMLRSLEYVACYYVSGSYRTLDYGYCVDSKPLRDLAYAVSFLPYYWRAMQCARRWFEEGDRSHLVNLGKYVSAMLAAGAKVAYEKDRTPASLWLLVTVSGAATVYQLYWDFVKDWGLLQAGSKNPWLRDDLILKSKSVYYLSMGLNVVLRLAWLQTVIHPNVGNLDSRVTSFFLAALEVIRRGHWNFYRLENEHLNNVGKFRAVKTVPLPFHEVDDD